MVTRYSGEWKTVKLGDCGKFISGNGFPLSYQGKQRGAYPFYKVSDMNNDGNGFYMIKANNYISVEIARTLSCNIIPQGAIVFAKIGAAIFLERKRITTCDCCIDNNMMAFLPNSDISSIFMCFMMERMKFGNFAQTTALPSLSGKNLAEIQVDLPPMDEQIAIAETLSALDRHLSNLSALIAKKQAIRQGALEDLMTGNWKRTTIAECAEILQGGTPNTNNPDYWGGNILWVTPSEITQCQSMYINDTERKITASGLKNSSARMLPAGTILLCTRATIGELAIASQPMTTNQGFKNLICRKNVNNVFFAYMLMTLKKQMISLAAGTTFLELSKSNLSTIEVNLPPLEEQSAIAHTLAALDSEISALNTQHSKLSAIRSAAINDLLSGKIRLTL